MSKLTDPTSLLLAARIRDLRTSYNWTLTELANRLPADHGTYLTGPLIGRIENGTRAMSVPELAALATALSTTVDYLTRAGELCPACGQERTL